MNWKFHPDAADEYLDATRHYLDVRPELAIAFAKSVETAIHDILSHPTAGPLVEEDVRRHLLKRFPFGIYYTIEHDFILIVAVMHMKRKPGYWRRRLRFRRDM